MKLLRDTPLPPLRHLQKVVEVTEQLFVYGTLKSTYTGRFGGDKRDRLHRESRMLGPAQLRGRLYDLGRYPGIVDTSEPGEIVHGELVALTDPTRTFIWLDAYEGIVSGTSSASEYRRELRGVYLLDAVGRPVGPATQAWVYIYARDLGGARLVPSGRWEP